VVATWAGPIVRSKTQLHICLPVLGLLLRCKGVTCLHASAVSFGEHSVAFVGPAGAGKSTTAATFARQGYGVISDDIAASG